MFGTAWGSAGFRSHQRRSGSRRWSPRERAARAWSAAGAVRPDARGEFSTSASICASSSGDAFSRMSSVWFSIASSSSQRAFPHEHALRENADAIANFLHLREQMRREQNGDAALLSDRE